MQLPFNPKSFLAVAGLFFIATVSAQLPSSSFSYSCTKDTVIECGPRCTTIKVQIPNIKAVSDSYVVNKTSAGGCFREYISPAAPGTTGNFGYDDVYSPAIALPFNFSFYNTFYNQLVIGANGTVSFDVSLAEQFDNWQIQNNLPSNSYDRAMIMAPFHDMNLGQTTSPNRQVKYDIVGTAPHRKWILSFYKVPLFDCNSAIQNIHQLVLHEGTGIVEVFVNSREVCSTWNGGNGMIGMQNYERTKGIMAPGRTATGPDWGTVNMNESWRFTPASGAPLFKKVELYTINGDFVANGDTVDAGNGNYNVSFNNVCIDSAAQYVVKSSYYHIEYPFQSPTADSVVYGTDTLLVVRNSPLVPQVAVTNAGCSNGGSITVSSPVGINYVYSLDNAVFQPGTVFNNLPPGVHTLTVSNINTGCTSSISVTVGIAQSGTTIKYPQSTYCYTETSTLLPVITGATGGGTFSASPQGLLIDSSSGEITITGSDTAFYTVTFDPADISQCVASTIVRIVSPSRFIWTGAVNSDWENAGNWSCNNIPGSTSNVMIYEGSVVINSNVTVKSLTVGPGTSVTVGQGSNLTVIDP